MDLFAPGTILATRYRIISELGRGGMGVVYVVEHVHTGQELALKVLSFSAGLTPSSVERFKREARAPARIKSENVVTVTDADVLPELGGVPFFVMERLRGRDLEAEIEARGKLPPHEVVEYLGQVSRALDRSHALGIVHRDLKPENLFLHLRDDGSSCLKILDFGISKVLDEGDGAMPASLTGSGALLGTPLYMSPEQATHGMVITRATDVWSLGLVAVRLLTGEYYWHPISIAELMVSILRDPLYPPTSRWEWLPPGFDVWFARACSRDPEQRFSSAGEAVDGLARVFGEVVPARGPVTTVVAPSGETSPVARSIEMAATVNDPTDAASAITPHQSSGVVTRPRKWALLGGAMVILFLALGVVGVRALGPRASAGRSSGPAYSRDEHRALDDAQNEQLAVSATATSAAAPRDGSAATPSAVSAPSSTAVIAPPPSATHAPIPARTAAPPRPARQVPPPPSPTHDPVAP